MTPLETNAAADLVLAVIVFRKQTGAEYAVSVLDITWQWLGIISTSKFNCYFVLLITQPLLEVITTC